MAYKEVYTHRRGGDVDIEPSVGDKYGPSPSIIPELLATPPPPPPRIPMICCHWMALWSDGLPIQRLLLLLAVLQKRLGYDMGSREVGTAFVCGVTCFFPLGYCYVVATGYGSVG